MSKSHGGQSSVTKIKVIFVLFVHEFDQLFLVWMHLNLVKKCVESKVESGFTHRRQCGCLGVRGGLLRGCTQRVHAFRLT